MINFISNINKIFFNCKNLNEQKYMRTWLGIPSQNHGLSAKIPHSFIMIKNISNQHKHKLMRTWLGSGLASQSPVFAFRSKQPFSLSSQCDQAFRDPYHYVSLGRLWSWTSCRRCCKASCDRK